MPATTTSEQEARLEEARTAYLTAQAAVKRYQDEAMFPANRALAAAKVLAKLAYRQAMREAKADWKRATDPLRTAADACDDAYLRLSAIEAEIGLTR